MSNVGVALTLLSNTNDLYSIRILIYFYHSEGHDVPAAPACFVGANYELVGISRTCANARDTRYLGDFLYAGNYEACGMPGRLTPCWLGLEVRASAQSESCHLAMQAGGHRHAFGCRRMVFALIVFLRCAKSQIARGPLRQRKKPLSL